eukprot:263868-Chlamydomonas_euryale.AAC.2
MVHPLHGVSIALCRNCMVLVVARGRHCMVPLLHEVATAWCLCCMALLLHRHERLSATDLDKSRRNLAEAAGTVSALG